MNNAPELVTRRLLLRSWRKEDLPAFAELNCDPCVMEYLPKLLTRQESDAIVERIQIHFCRHGFGWWAIEVVGGDTCIGFVGLQVVPFEAHFTPNVEVGWRLAKQHWGKGYASEAARVALDFGFRRADLGEIVSMTVPTNLRSRRVMERLGMHRSEADDFDHPKLPEGNPLRRHVLYRLNRDSWEGVLPGRERDNIPN